ncbi:MAG: succinylglutamate desuccinylase/aspartoacylase family protein [Gracilimonas sp.]|nr:succinylglutamate desuccinylase/aspartoacylase family protein [Gracilimonas sp.]MBO6587344.1 succinylglutamate desuccinylase/aspartoacylase family protein [Gracilimonas sp.]MBO6614170.1 succinylglutamate desuccinylase/aspartoacylase family protein [Gracilimonas sp.]
MHIEKETEQKKDDTSRIIWSHEAEVGPIFVVFAGVHGNETAGINACKQIANSLESMKGDIQGSVYMISGNKTAIEEGVRYIDFDLNRIWNELDSGSEELRESAEWKEALEIREIIKGLIGRYSDDMKEVYFIDLHTTSAKSCAFIPFNDTLENRRIALRFPVPQILGIEESIHGTLLSYINDLGYPAIGFEAGSHTDPLSIERTEAFLWIYLDYVNIVNLGIKKLRHLEEKLRPESDIPIKYYEINHHYMVEDPEVFRMKKGYVNFDSVRKGDFLAYDDYKRILAPVSGFIFMPLYQKKGNDGFFILKGRSPFWLEISSIFRDSFLNNYLHYLPGVEEFQPGAYSVNLTIARFFVKEIFHLLGYRVIRKDENRLICYKRI